MFFIDYYLISKSPKQRHMANFEERLLKLEKSARIYKTLSIALCGILGVMTIFSFDQKNQPPDVIQTKRLQIVDDAGNVFVKLEKDNDGGIIASYNNRAKYTFFASSSVKGFGQLDIGNGNGKSNLHVAESNAGGGFLGILNESNYYVAEMGSANSDGGGYVEVNDNNGYSKASIFANKNSDGAFEAYSNSNNRIVYLGGSNSNTGGLWLNNNYGQIISKLPN